MLVRRQLTFLVFLGAAFAWGYFGESFRASPAAPIPNESKNLEPAKPIAEAKPAVPAPVAATVFPSGPPPRPPGAEAPAREAPARQLTPPQGSLATTLDSIQPGKAQDTQIEQRNAYFDRLSQQLKELNTTGNGAVAPIPGAPVPPDNPYAAPAPLQIQADPVAPPGLEANEEPDNLEEEEALDDADLDPIGSDGDGGAEEEDAGMEP